MDTLYSFKNCDQLGQSLVSDQIEANVYSWLQWGFLGIGAFTNINLSTPAIYGTMPLSTLRPVVDPRFPAPVGQTYVYEGPRTDWVWESGVPYASQPTQISGVYVNSSFVPIASTGAYKHKILYPEGRVLFSNPVPTGATVQVEHSYRQVHVRRVEEPWFKELVFRSFRNDENFAQPAGSGGAWEILAQNRVQLPAVVIETEDRVKIFPYEIGNGSRVHRQDVLMHVLSETSWERRRLHDLLVEQYDKRIQTFDRNNITFPLDFQGTPISGAMTYPQLAAGNPWRQMIVHNIQSTPQGEVGDKLFWTTVRYTLEIDCP